jgi:hypothetical protein
VSLIMGIISAYFASNDKCHVDNLISQLSRTVDWFAASNMDSTSPMEASHTLSQ